MTCWGLLFYGHLNKITVTVTVTVTVLLHNEDDSFIGARDYTVDKLIVCVSESCTDKLVQPRILGVHLQRDLFWSLLTKEKLFHCGDVSRQFRFWKRKSKRLSEGFAQNFTTSWMLHLPMMQPQYPGRCVHFSPSSPGYSYGYGYERVYFTYKDLCSNPWPGFKAIFPWRRISRRVDCCVSVH
jgi:hypothetical protein